MTTNQIAYFQALEQQMHNRNTEAETARSNKEREKQAQKELQELHRHQFAVESETALHNSLTRLETARSNRAREGLTQQSNLINQNRNMQDYFAKTQANANQRYATDANLSLGLQTLSRQVSENSRHNRATEAIQARNAETQNYAARKNYEVNAINANTSLQRLRHDQRIDMSLTPVRIRNLESQTNQNVANTQYLLTKESVIPVELGYGFLNSVSQVGRAVGGLK